MKLSPWYLAALTPFAILGSQAIAHVAVLVITLGIFFGTLSLGRSNAASDASSSQSRSSAHRVLRS